MQEHDVAFKCGLCWEKAYALSTTDAGNALHIMSQGWHPISNGKITIRDTTELYIYWVCPRCGEVVKYHTGRGWIVKSRFSTPENWEKILQILEWPVRVAQ